MNDSAHYRECGMDLWDLLEDPDFQKRPIRTKDASLQISAFQRLAAVFAEDVEAAAHELVTSAVNCCGAQSAGISLEEPDASGELHFRWIAVAGTFAKFLHGTTPRFFSPCGTTLNRGRAQLYTVGKDYYDFLGIEAEPITDGILIPWDTGSHRGTIWAVSHRPGPFFDFDDYRLLDALAYFAAVAIREQHQPRLRLAS